MARLQGKVAIVTGGAKGIGRHYSQALAAEGARVMIADIADGKELAAEIAGRHGADSVASATFDVSDETAVKNLVAQTVERFGQIDILVNNAALYSTLHPRNFDEWDPDLWDRVMAINVRGPWLMVRARRPAHDRAALRQDHQHRLGRRLQGRAAHAALRHLEGRDVGVHAFAVARTRSIRHRGQFAVARLYPQRHRAGECARTWRRSASRCAISRAFKRDAYPEDLLGALVFLASSESDFVTGQSLVVDGGAVNN